MARCLLLPWLLQAVLLHQSSSFAPTTSIHRSTLTTSLQACNHNENHHVAPKIHKPWSTLLTTTLASFSLAANLFMVPLPVEADSRVVGQIAGSGIVFKDTLTIESFDDPKVQGVTLYVSNFQRPLTERLSSAKNFFSDPSYASVACAKTGPIKIADNIAKGAAGEEVFEESKSILFKTLRVQRIYDEQRQTMVYVSFNTRLDKNDDSNKSRFKSSVCAVGLE